MSTRQKMTAARVVQRPVLAVHRVLGNGPVVEVNRRGARWDLDLREGIDFAIWLRGYFEPATVAAYRRLVRPGSTVVDVGANIGAHTLHLAGAVGPTGRVIAFEPSSTAFRRLQRNVTLNPKLNDRVVLRQSMLLASAAEKLPPSVVSSWPLLPRRHLDAVHPGRAQSTRGASAATLDHELHQLGVDSVHFVKLDVDGFELDVLLGGQCMLSESAPTILFELAPSVLDLLGRRIEDVVELLTSHRYRVESLAGRPVTVATLAELRRRRASMNARALPLGGPAQS